jgi:hypothetical protein
MTPNSRMFILLLGSLLASGQESSKHPCCACGGINEQVVNICLTSDEIRNRIRHLEPLRLSGVERNVDITGTIVLDVRFGPDGKLDCTTAREGNPIAISAATGSAQVAIQAGSLGWAAEASVRSFDDKISPLCAGKFDQTSVGMQSFTAKERDAESGLDYFQI